MGSWVKIFKDQTKEHGSDKDIELKKASWSKGRLDNIISVQLFEKSVCCVLSVPNTEWYQYDRYMASLSVGSQSFRSARVVQAKITPSHVGKYISSSYAPGALLIEINTKSKNGILVKAKDVNLWLTAYILVNKKIGLTVCEKGAFNGDKQILG